MRGDGQVEGQRSIPGIAIYCFSSLYLSLPWEKSAKSAEVLSLAHEAITNQHWTLRFLVLWPSWDHFLHKAIESTARVQVIAKDGDR